MTLSTNPIDIIIDKAREITDPLTEAGTKTHLLESFVRIAAMSRALGFDMGLPNARFHVVSDPETDGWAVMTQDPEDTSLRFHGKRDALSQARKMARRTGGMLVIHDEAGDIISTYHYKPAVV